jgi:hypothetical protein
MRAIRMEKTGGENANEMRVMHVRRRGRDERSIIEGKERSEKRGSGKMGRAGAAGRMGPMVSQKGMTREGLGEVSKAKLGVEEQARKEVAGERGWDMNREMGRHSR